MMTIRVITVLFILAATVFPQQLIVIGPNVQVSNDHGDWDHNEVILSTDPNDAKHLVAGSMIFDQRKNDYSVVTYTSFDRGQTWQPTLEVGSPEGTFGDPATAFGCGGIAYSAALATRSGDKDMIVLHRSSDGGKIWSSPTSLPFIDREYITVDCTTTKRRGYVYIHGNSALQTVDGSKVYGTKVLKSIDEGETFTEKSLPPTVSRSFGFAGNGVVLSDGTFVAAYVDSEDKNLLSSSFVSVFRSEDGGNSFSNRMVSKVHSLGLGVPTLAVDQSSGPFRDRLYLVWTDNKSERSEVMLAFSSDKGITWSEPSVVNDWQSFSSNEKEWKATFRGIVAVNRAGVVGVMWYDRRDSTKPTDWTVRFSVSLDGGKTFVPSVRVSEAPFAYEEGKPLTVEFHNFGGGNSDTPFPSPFLRVLARATRAYHGGGDTVGLAAGADGLFHLLWIDNRTGIPQVWTAPVTVNGIAIRNGSREFQDLEDVTQKVMFKFSEPEYDHRNKTISVNAYLYNTSKNLLTGPIIVRVLEIASEEAEILNADNRLPGKGAVWDYTHLLKDDKLEPGQRTNGKLLQFRVLNISARQVLNGFVSFDAEVLGRP